MKRILIGSSAIRHHPPDFERKPKDTDYIGVGPKSRHVEYLINPVFDDYPYDVLQPDDIYTLKVSHIFWNIKWEKHMFDIQFLKEKGCVLKMDLFHKLYDY